MIKSKRTTREKKYEIVYESYADDIYRLCLYCLKDKEQAADITQQVFLNFYKFFNEVNPDYMLGYLVREAKELLPSSQNHEFTGEEVRECVTIGKE